MLSSLLASARARFPDPATAPSDFYPIATGGDLEPLTLLAAYSLGYFPWYNRDEPILWWSPDPRCVLYPQDFRLPSRSRRYLRNSAYKASLDRCFQRSEMWWCENFPIHILFLTFAV